MHITLSVQQSTVCYKAIPYAIHCKDNMRAICNCGLLALPELQLSSKKKASVDTTPSLIKMATSVRRQDIEVGFSRNEVRASNNNRATSLACPHFNQFQGFSRISIT